MTTSREVPPAPARRANLTQVPLFTGPLPPVDPDTPLWPGRVATGGGGELYVREVAGPETETAVYVHGLGGSSTNWTDLAGLLATRMQGFIVDLPGFGRSEPPRGFPYTLEAHAGVVTRFIEELGHGPVHLFGNSMGGAISMLVAAGRPDLVRTLTLVSPAVPDLRPSPWRISDPRLPLAYLPLLGRPARRALAAMPPRQRAEQMIRLVFAHPEEVPPQRLRAAEEEVTERLTMPWAGDALGRSTVGLVRSWLARRPRSLWTVARRIEAPTLVVWGTQDRLVSVRKAPRTAELIRRGRLLVLPRTGHVAQMERPESVARAVLGMLDAVARERW
ncbi:MAG TPA: alpha/beta hydrolase [Pseudonocardiaceae bacterium]